MEYFYHHFPISFLTLQRSLSLLNLFTKRFWEPMALDEKFVDFIEIDDDSEDKDVDSDSDATDMDGHVTIVK